jgi:hypothetical protein
MTGMGRGELRLDGSIFKYASLTQGSHMGELRRALKCE